MTPKQARLRLSAVRKLEPIRTSGKFRAILAYLLDVTWTEPAITDLVITSDGGIVAQHEGDLGCNDFLGTETDLMRNLDGISKLARLTKPEGQYLRNRIATCVPSVTIAAARPSARL